MEMRDMNINYETYVTDVDSLIKLNEEAIVNDHGVYAVLSDSLNVPNFITKEQFINSLMVTKDNKKAQVTYIPSVEERMIFDVVHLRNSGAIGDDKNSAYTKIQY